MSQVPTPDGRSQPADTTRFHNIILLDVLRRVAAEFQERDIPLLTMKGAAFLGREYPDLSMRPMTDLDILVRGSDFKRAGEALVGLGATRSQPAHILHAESYERLYYFPFGPTWFQIDVHYAFAHPQAYAIDYDRVFQDAELHPLDDLGRLSVRCPSAAHSLINLALHQAYDAYGPDLKNLYDGERILRCHAIDASALESDASAWGVRSALYLFLMRGRALGIMTDVSGLIAALGPSPIRGWTIRLMLDPARRDLFRLAIRSKRVRQILLFYLLCDRVKPAVHLPLHILRLKTKGLIRCFLRQ